MLLDPTLSLPPSGAPPSDDEILSELKRKSARGCAGLAEQASFSGAVDGKALDDVTARNDHDLLQRLHKNIVTSMQSIQLGMIKQSLGAEHISVDQITDDLRRDWVTQDGRFLIQAYPKGNARDHQTLIDFTDAVRRIAPDASGAPISIRESGHTITGAFIHAGIYALLAIRLLALVVLRRIADVARFAGAAAFWPEILTLATMVVIGLPVEFCQHHCLTVAAEPRRFLCNLLCIIRARRAAEPPAIQHGARGSFQRRNGVLWLSDRWRCSPHTGTAGMGKLLVIALFWSLLCTFIVLPALCVEKRRNLTDTAKCPT